ncbi:MAG TPA: Uma2 family endonuclease [Pyrinomonadaceae bacterium]|nr:Uma2 family endonuclease [Pyrinomonadaceae bacterium]
MNEKVPNQPVKQPSIEDYLTSERATAKNEFNNGRTAPRIASNRWRSLIVSNIAIALGSRLSGNKCEIYISNMRVRMKTGAAIFPDLVVVSGEPAFADQDATLLLNPTVAIDVFSSQTNSTDKTQRLENFLAMDSIKECIQIKEDEMRIEHFSKQNAKQWIYRIYNERDDVVSLESINCKMSLSEVYAQIKFRQPEIASRAVN